MEYKLRIVFMGTPEFAVASLEALVKAHCNVVGVVTAPDKPMGRGKKLGTSAVKDYAISQKLNILQPTNLKDPDFLQELKALNADVQIVVAFRMLPEVVWDMPPLGSYNLHGSLLPDYRGAAPINWAIINGERETGVTTFKLKHEIDTGNILFQEREPINYEDNVGTVYDRLMRKGAQLIVKTIEALNSGEVDLIPQIPNKEPKHAPKIFREDCEINWDQSSEIVRNFIRGLSPYPAAWTTLDGQTFKIFSAELAPQSYGDPAGTIKTDNKSYLDFVTADGALRVTEVQMQGKKRMKTDDFLRGYQINL
ncbi:methionyl-tRNA formyltransferase [Marinoscillum sp. MHG1-6]|uniref:methionyl-tRNA formyltransferase n=1 Tax=Marinoscillum sp. MHG1-6 TaxID=2959627 RepID=UPI0021584D24|nr:methionyl-tRNA formyltransferase [Marinoscillum sp. MHG1-6]